MHINKNHEHWMSLALYQAKCAKENNEVPVGAVITIQDELVSSGFNQPISTHDPTAHAEIIAIRAACSKINNYRLTQATLYVTLEPCLMCYWAMMHARIKCCVFGATDQKVGVFSNQLIKGIYQNHTFSNIGGVLEEQCQKFLTDFFHSKRQ